MKFLLKAILLLIGCVYGMEKAQDQQENLNNTYVIQNVVLDNKFWLSNAEKALQSTDKDSVGSSCAQTLHICDCKIVNEVFSEYASLGFSSYVIENSELNAVGLQRILGSVRPETLNSLVLPGNEIDHSDSLVQSLIKGECSDLYLTKLDLRNNPCGGEKECQGHEKSPAEIHGQIEKIIWSD